MIPKANYIYRCCWWGEDGATYTNVITAVNTTGIYGYCIDDTDNPNHTSECEWDFRAWDSDEHIITELGHIDDLPELFI